MRLHTQGSTLFLSAFESFEERLAFIGGWGDEIANSGYLSW